ncbi:MAG: transposase [Bacteroidota bacterium]
MPSHIHLVWELLERNGNEMPNASFTKFTGHKFLEELRKNQPRQLRRFGTNKDDRSHNFWIEKPLPKLIYTPEVIYQKLDYMHNNPCQGKWMLAPSPVEYEYSSAAFYDLGGKDFGFLSHIGERI